MKNMENSRSKAPKTAIVVGAGIAGISTALYLQYDGHKVEILDPELPGSMTSFGNAGLVATYATIPTGTPDILLRVPQMLMNSMGPLSLRWSCLPQLTPWLISLICNSVPSRIQRNSVAKSLLLNKAWHDYRPLIQDAGAQDLVYAGGMLRVFRTAEAFERMQQRELQLLEVTGRKYEWLNADEIRQLEPNLVPIFRHAFYSTDSRNIRNPGRLMEAFAQLFVSRGGIFRQEAVIGLSSEEKGKWRVSTRRSEYCAEILVIAAGAWSRNIAKMLGIRLLLDTERGYHIMLPIPEKRLNRSVHFGEEGFMLSPMETGYRISTGLELAGIDAPPDYRRIRHAAFQAAKFVKSLKVKEQSIWMGRRPSTPDSVPILGGVTGREGLYFATGGAHIGMTLGPTFGRIIADLVVGRDPGIDLRPYSPSRW